MNVLHGTWIPESHERFTQSGNFYLWVESETTNNENNANNEHPRTLQKHTLATFLRDEIGIKEISQEHVNRCIVARYFALPRVGNTPVKSYELLKYADEEAPTDFTFGQWKIWCYQVPTVEIISLLNEIHFLFVYHPSNMLLGADLLFWYHYTQLMREILLRDQYIPALKYREFVQAHDSPIHHSERFQIYPAWEIVSEKYEAELQKYVELMPQICLAGSEEPDEDGRFFSKEPLLRHFSDILLSTIILHTPSTAKFDNKISDTLLYDCMYPHRASVWNRQDSLEDYQRWATWKARLSGQQTHAPFTLCFQLQEAGSDEDSWFLHFLISSKEDPSLRMSLDDYWYLDEITRQRVQQSFGEDIEKHILLNLGYAARMYPKIWDGLETEKPTNIQLTLEDAFDFLKEYAWILEDSGYKVVIPAWWTPEGRRRAKLMAKSSLQEHTEDEEIISKGFMGLNRLVEYRYELSIGNEVISLAEWEELVRSKTPLVKFRGKWMEVDSEHMQQLLDFWQTHANERHEMSMLNFMKMSADEELEFAHDDALRQMMTKLHDKSQFEVIPDPPSFQGSLRKYQKRGVSWIQYLEHLGLNGCLADDMGLGKTIQVIARLVREREGQEQPLPTLLIAPTSVLGNWQKEMSRFAPQLRTIIHHGSSRTRKEVAFREECLKHDMVISSYALARIDAPLFRSVSWERIVLDEAQNIKNPQAAQTKALLKFNAKHRLTLTGTPVENRLQDLWSLFNFLNPGYLGTRTNFRGTFEIPIQKDSDRIKTRMLKHLTEPFILRRVKTDKQIIKDLPEKVEQKVYCNLSKEQASLYEAVVRDVAEQLEAMKVKAPRKLIFSTLIKLKQICNHPAQFFHDGSEFSRERSHKLSRLLDMIAEVIENEESLLIFSQFREICEVLEKLLSKTLHYSTYMIHGGTSRTQRQKFIEEFQDPETEPAIFIISLKAGGLGVTLTKANHVFHFDRWWNPAVENQATDRAFRIGQTKNVFVHKFIVLGTLEERIDQMIEDKKQLADSIIGTDESWLSELDNEAFKSLIALNKSAILE